MVNEALLQTQKFPVSFYQPAAWHRKWNRVSSARVEGIKKVPKVNEEQWDRGQGRGRGQVNTGPLPVVAWDHAKPLLLICRWAETRVAAPIEAWGKLLEKVSGPGK